MKIKVARRAGFCFGVKRAINIAKNALKELKPGDKIYSLGPIIHNPQVVEELFKEGLQVISGLEKMEPTRAIPRLRASALLRTSKVPSEIEGRSRTKPAIVSVAGECIKSGTVIISSHGAPLEVIGDIKKKGMKLIDATCPFVKYAQNIVRSLKKEGYGIVIVGDSAHPEVKALKSIAGKNKNSKKIGIISQTTQSKENYTKEIKKILKQGFSEVKIFNTICNDTSKRQLATRRLLEDCDLVIVVGGKNSANTKRLWQICKESGVDSFHIETELEVSKDWFSGKKCVGITSGASTPDLMVKKIIERIRRF